MTATRVCIILLVLIAVLFAVSIAVGHRQHGNSSTNLSDWQDRIPSFLNRATPVRPDEIVNCPQRQGNVIVVPRIVSEVNATIKPDTLGNKVRKLRLKFDGPDTFAITFSPSPDDPLGLTNSCSCRAGQSTNIVIMEHGGRLNLRRAGSLGDGRIQIL
jgi:hypothetical protein